MNEAFLILQVWNYIGDGYVHRLLSSLEDGKVIELARPVRGGDDIDAEMEVALQTSKYDAIAMEYNQMTLACLDSQRQHFEERLAEKDLEKDVAIAQEVEKANHRAAQKMGAKVNEVEKELREAKLVRMAGFQIVRFPFQIPRLVVVTTSVDTNLCELRKGLQPLGGMLEVGYQGGQAGGVAMFRKKPLFFL